MVEENGRFHFTPGPDHFPSAYADNLAKLVTPIALVMCPPEFVVLEVNQLPFPRTPAEKWGRSRSRQH